MTHAFRDNLLDQRDRRTMRRARMVFLAKRTLWWLGPLIASALLVFAIAGIAEGRAELAQSDFEWPWQWLPRLLAGEGRPIHDFTGFLLVLLVGVWLTIGGIGLLRFALRFGYGPLAVARSVVDEAIRNKIVIVTIGILVLALAVQPWWSLSQNVEQPLRYKIQTFLSVSSLLTTLLLGVVTILFSAFTVAQDLSVRRTGDVFVKPIGRVTYLIGKWIGVILLMAVVLVVQATLTYGVGRFWLGNHIALNLDDFTTVRDRVLTAREEVGPLPEIPFEQTATERLSESARIEPDMIERRGAANVFQDYELQERIKFLQVPFGERTTYVFSGLGDARDAAEALDERIRANRDTLAEQLGLRPEDITLETLLLPEIRPIAEQLGYNLVPGALQFRFKVQGTNTYGTSEERWRVELNDRLINQPISAPIDEVQVKDIPATLVNEDGELRMTIINDVPDSLGRERALQFEAETWLRVYYKEGSFGTNVARGSFVQWIRLVFLAMLGIIAGSLLSFPVAATATLSFWILAAGGSSLQSVLYSRIAQTEVGAVDTTVNDLVLPFVRAVVGLLARYSEIGVGNMLIDGRYINLSTVAWHVVWIGLVWTGMLLLVGGFLFRRKEIARVQV